MFDLDTRLLQIFFEIYKHSSVSKAAEQLEIGQPTLSIALNKLREHFHLLNQTISIGCRNSEPTKTGSKLQY